LRVFKSTLTGLLVAVIAAGQASQAEAEMFAELGEIDGQVVWVDFWASWCAPCRRSFPWMNQMLSRYQDEGLQIIGVNVDKEREMAETFLAETPADFDLRYDPAGSLAEQFGVVAMPSSFVLDAEGNVIAAHFGFRFAETDEYEQEIINALAGVDADRIR
jgi:thiol-disulfide isomerase/thioredoxin